MDGGLSILYLLQLGWKEYVQVIRNQDKPTATENLSLNTLQALPKEEKRKCSNKTHLNPADRDARMAKKKGKPCRLYHLASMAVDSFRHVITHIQANFADEKDSRHLLAIVKKTRKQLKALDVNIHKALADAAFSSGSNYAALEAAHIEGYVALYGQNHKQREGFLMMLPGMYTSVVKLRYFEIKVSNLILATLTTSISAVQLTAPVAFVARPYQKEMLW